MDEQLTAILSRDSIVVVQATELTNVILGFDSANRYNLFGPDGEQLGMAAEEGGGAGGWFLRQFLNSKRPCTMHIYGKNGQEVATGKKPFRFIFSEMSALVNGQILGRARRRFSILKRKYTIEAQGSSPFDIESSIFQFGKFTFDITRNGAPVATITKHYEGMMKMAFTQADSFSITFKDTRLTLEERFALLFALFLIDFDVFEQN
ncbi:MAG: phospholipid scramblase-related protein [Candidatus Poseidoniaceae archaeon]|jgi:hypothetical protein|nr:phospholipid scramblase-related protein [Candidatus Poseidoniaceae archaeon]